MNCIAVHFDASALTLQMFLFVCSYSYDLIRIFLSDNF